MPAPTSDRPVGGSALAALRVACPQTREWRAYAALGPKTVLLAVARTRRRRFAAIPFGITGSVGKTSTSVLLAGALVTLGPVVEANSRNRARGFVAAVRRLTPEARFYVQVGASGPGTVDELFWALDPRVATLLLDTRKATPSTLRPALDALAGIPARRRVAVIGSLWYFDVPPDEAYAAAVTAARAVADEVIVYAPDAPRAVDALHGLVRVRVIPWIEEIARLVRERRPRATSSSSRART